MKKIALFAFVLMAFVATSQAQTWETNYAEAVSKAKKENKTLLLDFTGSDWCGWCIKLDREVFSKKEFQEYAQKNLVLVKLDFPRRKQLPQTEQTQNQKLAGKYGVQGLPTILLLDKNEKLIAQTGYQRGGAKKYVEHLEAQIRK